MNMMTEQKPLISGFGAKTTAEEALAGRDLRGKVAIVASWREAYELKPEVNVTEDGQRIIIQDQTSPRVRDASTLVRTGSSLFSMGKRVRFRRGQVALR